VISSQQKSRKALFYHISIQRFRLAVKISFYFIIEMIYNHTMSNELAKFLNSRRRHKTDVAISRQVKIAKQHGLVAKDKPIKQPHRLAKHHAMDCGNPGCAMCGNPRHIFKDSLTVQEKRMFQDVEKTTDRHSNGLVNKDDDGQSS
jgi:hypothetical protein